MAKREAKKVLFTLLGALIVFTTFVVKDAWHDHLKDQMAEEERAVDIALIRFDVFRGNRKASRTESIKATRLAGRQGFTDLGIENLSLGRDTLVEQVGDLAAYIEGLKDSIYQAELQEPRDMGLLSKEYDAVTNDAHSLANMELRDRKTFEQILQLQEKSYDELDKEFGVLMQVTADFTLRGRARHQELERKYNRWTLFSFVLYTVGWGFALYGRLSGYGGAEEERA